MSNKFRIPTTGDFIFRHAVGGHGWYDLAPFEYDEAAGRLDYAYESRRTGRSEALTMTAGKRAVEVSLASRRADAGEASDIVGHILRLDEAFDDFYSSVSGFEGLAWVRRMSAGRLLRSATVFEDLVKTLCTTNCSWSLTKVMTANLVEKLGKPGIGGKKSFPSAQAIASMPEQFFRAEIKAGYRSPYFVELGETVASGKLDPEAWLRSELPTEELRKEIKGVKGIGDYAADNLLKLLGRYDGLALDSWLRAGFYKKHNREKPCPDKKIEKHYRKFGKWKGLAIWCDMTEHWFVTGR
ncbi:MAG: DNA-3-methyladenine glycosylase [Pyrinomonadaceae bacterium]